MTQEIASNKSEFLPSPTQSRTWADITVDNLATPTFVPAINEATSVPCPAQSAAWPGKAVNPIVPRSRSSKSIN
jgi:hypothetical protein